MKIRSLDSASMISTARELSRLATIAAETETTDPIVQMEQAAAHRIAEQFQADMSQAADLPPEPPASAEDFEATELALGLKLPVSLRRLYGGVANGGFGPGQGLLPLAAIVAETLKMRRAQSEGFPFEWPAAMIAIEEPSFYAHCLDTRSGEVVALDTDPITPLNWDKASEEELRRAWGSAFQVVAPDLASWIAAWVAGPDPEEVAAQQAALAHSNAEARSHWAKQVEQGIADFAHKSPEERRAMGLPDVGWEDEMRRGAGLD
jgi:hypothetical protein